MSSEEQSLLRAVLESPRDDAQRLIYADWLEEQARGERAEFIRVQIELTRANAKIILPSEPEFEDECSRWAALGVRERELFHFPSVESWPDISELICTGVAHDWRNLDGWRRGFVYKATLACHDWLALGPRIVRAAPIETVRLSDKAAMRLRKSHWGFCCYPGDYHATRYSLYHLPEELFKHLPPESYNGVNHCFFNSEQRANDALSDACLAYAREFAAPALCERP